MEEKGLLGMLDAKKTLDRRQFTLATALAALSGVAITISACGGSYSAPTNPTGAGIGNVLNALHPLTPRHGFAVVTVRLKVVR